MGRSLFKEKYPLQRVAGGSHRDRFLGKYPRDGLSFATPQGERLIIGRYDLPNYPQRDLFEKYPNLDMGKVYTHIEYIESRLPPINDGYAKEFVFEACNTKMVDNCDNSYGVCDLAFKPGESIPLENVGGIDCNLLRKDEAISTYGLKGTAYLKDEGIVRMRSSLKGEKKVLDVVLFVVVAVVILICIVAIALSLKRNQ